MALISVRIFTYGNVICFFLLLQGALMIIIGRCSNNNNNNNNTNVYQLCLLLSIEQVLLLFPIVWVPCERGAQNRKSNNVLHFTEYPFHRNIPDWWTFFRNYTFCSFLHAIQRKTDRVKIVKWTMIVTMLWSIIYGQMDHGCNSNWNSILHHLLYSYVYGNELLNENSFRRLVIIILIFPVLSINEYRTSVDNSEISGA